MEIKVSDISGNICAVDSGFLPYRLHGIDFLIIRAAAVNFSYAESKLLSCFYIPSKVPEPEILMKLSLDDHESNIWRSIMRLQKEVSIAIAAAEKFSPSVLLFDGSIVPLASDRPEKESSLFSEYAKLIELYKQLFQLCKDKNIMLAGVIKDSRGKRFMELAFGNKQQKMDYENCSDSVFLDYLLKKGERTAVMNYSGPAPKQPILKDLGEFANNLYVSYLKINSKEQPLRVDFMNFDGDFNKPLSSVYSLSAIAENYAYPPPLTEVDLCAAVGDVEMEQLKGSLMGFSQLRRNSRPFR